MFPEPIQKAPFLARGSYRIILYVTLIVWMLPLAGVFLTSFRSLADINQETIGDGRLNLHWLKTIPRFLLLPQ